MKKLLAIVLFTQVLISSCSKDSDPDPLINNLKSVRMEVDFSGTYTEYELLLYCHTLRKVERDDYVEPVIISPLMNWTEKQGASTYFLRDSIDFNKIIIESKEQVHTFGFTINAIYEGENPVKEGFETLTADIKIIADDEIVKTYRFKMLPVDQVTQPLGETIRF